MQTRILTVGAVGDIHEELRDRLRDTPESAACRGFYINMLDRVAASLSADVQRTYRERFPVWGVSSMRMHSVRDYLRRTHCIAVAGFGEEKLAHGLAHIQGYAIETFESSLLGRSVRMLTGNSLDGLMRVVAWLSANRQLAVNYGTWSFRRLDEHVIEGRFEEEYNYIESAMAGALEALVRARGLDAILEVCLEDRFTGTITIRTH